MAFNLFFVIVFIFGLFAGSFLNCVVYRLEIKKSFLRGRSFCPKCGHTLAWYDLIPIFSFIALKGRCRYCGQNISIQYPLVELATGLAFLLIFNGSAILATRGLEFSIFKFSNAVNLIFSLVIVCFLEIIFVYDLKHYIIPDKVLYPVIGIVALLRIIDFFSTNYQLPNTNYLFAGLSVAGFFFIIWLASKGRAMGFADAPLGFLLGLWLGFPVILIALFLAFFTGSVAGLVLIGLGRKKMKSPVPFGPFLISGAFIAFFWGEKIWNLYSGFLGF